MALYAPGGGNMPWQIFMRVAPKETPSLNSQRGSNPHFFAAHFFFDLFSFFSRSISFFSGEKRNGPDSKEKRASKFGVWGWYNILGENLRRPTALSLKRTTSISGGVLTCLVCANDPAVTASHSANCKAVRWKTGRLRGREDWRAHTVRPYNLRGAELTLS